MYHKPGQNSQRYISRDTCDGYLLSIYKEKHAEIHLHIYFNRRQAAYITIGCGAKTCCSLCYQNLFPWKGSFFKPHFAHMLPNKICIYYIYI